MSRPTSTTSTAASVAAASANLQKTLSLKHPAIGPQLSSVTLFLRNLRLLDLDLREDWPDITVATFSTKDAQNQKHRITAVEWSLYRLFEIWDPQETREKLQPFFPPLEPLQSLNLRAALYRSLNDLKKNGDLGRETVLRKTMLDECKGERLIEILVIFSTAVLHKVTQGRKSRRKHTTIAKQLATAPTLSASHQASLIPLAIAHKAALSSVLKKKQERRAQYKSFSELLEVKSKEAVARNEQCGTALDTIESSGKDFPDMVAVKKTLHENWLGNPEWLEVMVHGDQAEADNEMFQMQFEDIWMRVQQAREIEEEYGRQKSLLQDLDARVKGQEERLSRWKAFHAKLKQAKESGNEGVSLTSAADKTASGSFNFNRHQEYPIGTRTPQGSAGAEQRSSGSRLSQEYSTILGEMRELLDAANKSQTQRPPPRMPKAKSFTSSLPMRPSTQKTALSSRSRAQTVPQLEPESELQREPSPEHVAPSPPTLQRPVSPDWFSPLGKSEQSHAQNEKPELTDLSPERAAVATDDEGDGLDYISDRGHESPKSVREPQVASQQESPLYEGPIEAHPPTRSAPLESVSQPPSPLNMEERLAEQIISSIGDATPSPIKRFVPRPSLMERTRVSMGFSESPLQQDEEETSPLPEEEPSALDPEEDRRAALLARTMASMSALPDRPKPPAPVPSKLKSRKSISRSKRQSLYPDRWGESPRRISAFWDQADEKREITPTERLFEAEADAESVFKSRPKVAVSPMMTPKVDNDEDYEGLSEIGDDTLGDVVGDSPLKGRG